MSPERGMEVRLDPDRALNEFIDTLDLPRSDSELLKAEALRPPVRQELNGIWHVLEMHDAKDEAMRSISQLIYRLKH